MHNPEHNEQVALIRWARRQQSIYPALEYLIAIPNGGARNVVTAARLKAEGVKRGVSDLFLAFPMRQYHGLWIEMKVPPNKPTPEQRAWLAGQSALGYATATAYSWEEAREQLERYLSGKWEEKRS